jgi:hypothetical protein
MIFEAARPLAGMKHIFDDGRARATVLRFGRLSSELLAWGAADGTVRVAMLGDAPRLLHVRPSPPAARPKPCNMPALTLAPDAHAAPAAVQPSADPYPFHISRPGHGHGRMWKM